MKRDLDESMSMIDRIGHELLAQIEANGFIPPNTELSEKTVLFCQICKNTFSNFYELNSPQYQAIRSLTDPEKLSLNSFSALISQAETIIEDYRTDRLQMVPSKKPDLFRDGYIIMDDDYQMDD